MLKRIKDRQNITDANLEIINEMNRYGLELSASNKDHIQPTKKQKTKPTASVEEMLAKLQNAHERAETARLGPFQT